MSKTKNKMSIALPTAMKKPKDWFSLFLKPIFNPRIHRAGGEHDTNTIEQEI